MKIILLSWLMLHLQIQLRFKSQIERDHFEKESMNEI